MWFGHQLQSIFTQITTKFYLFSVAHEITNTIISLNTNYKGNIIIKFTYYKTWFPVNVPQLVMALH